MKDFAGSTITYYGLARERVLKKYPWLISVLVILVLISMSGLALFLISDLVSFVSNSDHKGIFSSLGPNGPSDDIASVNEDRDNKSGSDMVNGAGVLAGANSSSDLDSLNRSAGGQKSTNGTQANESQSLTKSDKIAIGTGGSSATYVSGGGSSSSSKKHHSSSQSSSSAASGSSKSTKSSNASLASNLIESSNASLVSNLTESSNASLVSNLTESSNSLNVSAFGSSKGKSGMIGLTEENTDSKSTVAPNVDKPVTKTPDATLASVPSVALGGLIDPAKSASSNEPAKTIQFDDKSAAKDNSEPEKVSRPTEKAADQSISKAQQKAQEMKARLIEKRNNLMGNKDTTTQEEGEKSDSSQNTVDQPTSTAQQRAQEMKAKMIEKKNKMTGKKDTAKPQESGEEGESSQKAVDQPASKAEQKAQELKAKQAEMKKKAAELRAKAR